MRIDPRSLSPALRRDGGSTGLVARLAGLAALGSAHPPPYADLADSRGPEVRRFDLARLVFAAVLVVLAFFHIDRVERLGARNPSLSALSFGWLRGALAETLSLHRRWAAP
jgi:hypothetical protein